MHGRMVRLGDAKGDMTGLSYECNVSWRVYGELGGVAPSRLPACLGQRGSSSALLLAFPRVDDSSKDDFVDYLTDEMVWPAYGNRTHPRQIFSLFIKGQIPTPPQTLCIPTASQIVFTLTYTYKEQTGHMTLEE